MLRIAVPMLLLLACLISPSKAGTLAVFRTVFGDLEVELYDQEKPVTVSNFKRLVQSGAYQATFFHRLIPGFVAQAGGYFIFQPMATNGFAPPWNNLGGVPDFGQITNEFRVGPLLSNTNGTIAMAKLGSGPDTASCEWFFNLANNSGNLDIQNGGFTVFGRVVRDTGPVQYGGLLGMLNLFSPRNLLVSAGWWYPNDYAATNLFKSLPVTYAGTAAPRYMDLLYVNVSLLSTQVTVSNLVRYISWNSINGKTNLVEYASPLPSRWQTLTMTNGNGNRITVKDASANSTSFYRVRVLY